MSPLEQALIDYLSIRRCLGFRLREPGTCLRNFVTFLQIEGASYITRELALRWATQPVNAQPSTWAFRLGMVRRFALWHSASEPRTEIPPVGLLPHRYRRKPPHIYSDEEIERLLRRAQQLPSLRGSVPVPIQPFSVCSWRRECGSTKPFIWTGRMLT